MSAVLPKYAAGTGLMCFAGAMCSMKAGGLVRRASWRPLCWVGIDRGARFETLYFRLPNGQHERWMRPNDDLLAEDWEEALVPFGVSR